MAINLGAAYVDIVPSTKNLGPQLQRQMVGPAAAAGESAGVGFGSRFSAGVSNFLGGVSQTIDKTLTGVGIAAAGLGVVTFSKGWDRLTTIQDAAASLTITLGDSTKAAQLLDNVLNIVRGTPFNLDQFASAAQRLAGMGIAAEKIPSFLEAIGNASATQGKNADEFVSRLTRVFGQIKAQGRVMGQDLLQVSETGVNALAILANSYGVTTEEMRDMITKGAVPADRALQALADGIMNGSNGPAGATVALAGTMQALRQQLSGLVGGLGAAVSRLGEAALTPFIPVFSAGLDGMIKLVDKLAPKVKEFAQSIVDSKGFQKIADWAKSIPDLLSGASGAFEGLSGAIGPFLGLIASFTTKGIASIPFIGSFIPVIGPIVGAIGGIIAQSPELRESFGRLLESLARLGEVLIAAFVPVVEFVIPVIEKLVGFGIDGLTGAVNYVTDIVTTFQESGIGGVWDKIGEDWSNASPQIEAGLNSAWSSVTSWVGDKAEKAPGLFGGLADDFATGFDTVLNGTGDGNSPIIDSLDTVTSSINTKIDDTDFTDKVSKQWPDAFTGWVDNVINGSESGPGLVQRLQGITDSVDEWIDNGGIQSLLTSGARLGGALLVGWWKVVIPGAYRIIWGLAWSLIKAIGQVAWMFIQVGWSIATSIIEGIRNFFTEKAGGLLGEALMTGLKTIPVIGPAIGLIDGLSNLGGRATGGPVTGGTPYIVGEKGPELFVPGANGFITPNSALSSFKAPQADAPQYMTAPSGATFNITAPSTDARDIVRLSERAHRKQAVFAGGIGG